MQYNKPPITVEQQLDLLIQRGMYCQDRNEALHYLEHLNYCRLGAYWLPFEDDYASHSFKPGTCFADILNLYAFDRELRLLILDAIERVEVSIRAGWSCHLAQRYGAHAHLDASTFKRQVHNWDHAEQLRKLEAEARKSQEVFVQRHYQKYQEPLPPVWAVTEIMTLGQLSKWYGNLRHGADRNAVAHRYDMDETNLASFMHHLSTIRNLCAHHGRLWNREFTFAFRLPSHRPKSLVASLNLRGHRRLYNTLAVLAWLLDTISLQHHWKQRLLVLLAQHAVDPGPMGFPAGWEKMAIWQSKP